MVCLGTVCASSPRAIKPRRGSTTMHSLHCGHGRQWSSLSSWLLFNLFYSVRPLPRTNTLRAHRASSCFNRYVFASRRPRLPMVITATLQPLLLIDRATGSQPPSMEPRHGPNHHELVSWRPLPPMTVVVISVALHLLLHFHWTTLPSSEPLCGVPRTGRPRNEW